ncbi:protein FAM98C-like [Lampetra planeri]
MGFLSAQVYFLISDSDAPGNVLLVRELRNLLSDLRSPFSMLTSEVLVPSVLDKVTEFLVSELQAACIIKYKELHPEDKTTGEECGKEQRVEDHSHEITESYQENKDGDENNCRTAEIQAEWILLLHALGTDTASQLTDVLHEVESRLTRLPGDVVTKPLLNSSLSSEQWMKLVKINQVLTDDYHCRRQMMIKRFQVTLESFAWGEKTKEHSEALASIPPLASIAGSSRVSLPLLLAARADQSCIEPIKAGKSTDVYKKLMGHVPDRGGRPGEIEPPMPAWKEQRAKGNRSGRGGGRQHWHKFSDKKKKKGKDE